MQRNEGQYPILEVELTLFDSEKKTLEILREAVLGSKEEFVFKPIPALSEASYFLVCRYKNITSGQYYKTKLTFKVSKANKEGEIFVMPGELEFEIDAG